MTEILGRRAVAALIDVALVVVLLVVIAKTLGDAGARGWSVWAETHGGPRALFFALTFAYFFATELLWSQTLGKRVMKLRVVRADGSRLTAGPVLVRNVVRLVDWLPSLYVVGAVAVAATGERRQRLGDIAARTRVVADDAPPPAQPPRRPGDEDVLAQVIR